jgi:hypothetical protein
VGSLRTQTILPLTRMFQLLNDEGRLLKSYAVDVNTSRTPEEGAYVPSWPNGLFIIITLGTKILGSIMI